MEREWIGTSPSYLKKLIKHYFIVLVAVLEPFHKEDTLPRYANFLGFVHYCSNERQGDKIWILWEEKYRFDIVYLVEQSIMG